MFEWEEYNGAQVANRTRAAPGSAEFSEETTNALLADFVAAREAIDASAVCEGGMRARGTLALVGFSTASGQGVAACLSNEGGRGVCLW